MGIPHAALAGAEMDFTSDDDSSITFSSHESSSDSLSDSGYLGNFVKKAFV